MTQSLEALSRRTTSMKSIRSIVHTMKTLSVINAAPYAHAAEAIEAYHATVLDGLHAFLSAIGPMDPPKSGPKHHILIVFGSDHGLCGNYNEGLAGHVAARSDVFGKTGVLCIGAQMADALRDLGIVPEAQFFPPASVDGIARLANQLTQHLDDMRDRLGLAEISVSLAYLTRDGVTGQKPQILALLPLDPALVRRLQQKPWASRSLPAFSLQPDALFRALIRSHLFASLFRAAAEAMVTENAARLALMQQAERSVDDRLDGLMSDTRSLRQSEITTELLDMIIGFEALKKGKKSSTAQP